MGLPKLLKRFLARLRPRPAGCPGALRLRGRFVVRCRNADGSLAWEEELLEFPNLIPSTALNDILSVYYNGGSQVTTRYIGLIDSASYSAIAAADTMASHAGWIENTAYSEGTRRTWSPTVTGAQVTNATPGSFTSSGSNTIKGAFLATNNTKGGSTGMLVSAGVFPSAKALVNTQVLEVTYTCTAASG